MQVFTINQITTHVLCNTPQCFAEVRTLAPGEAIAPAAAEVTLCVIEGSVDLGAIGILDAMTGVQIPAGYTWHGAAGTSGAKVLRVDSPHPDFDAAQRLIVPLTAPHRFAVAGGQMMVYDDYVRGGVLTFAPGFIADKHFHDGADEIFWFFQGQCRVTGPYEEVVLDAGNIVLTPANEWHIIANAGSQPLLMFLTVTPNVVPSHTFFDADGKPYARSMLPLTKA